MDSEAGYRRYFFKSITNPEMRIHKFKNEPNEPSECGSFHDANERKNNFQQVVKNLKFYTYLCFLVKFAANIP